MEAKVLVIVVTYNGRQWIQKCLRSIQSSRKGAKIAAIDTLVVDNASTDETLELAQEIIPESSIIRTGANLGFGAANNIGFQYAIERGYDYVYLLNQDAYLQEDTIQKLVGASVKNPEYGILSPVQLNANGKADKNFARKTGIKQCLDNESTDVQKNVNSAVQEVRFVMAAHWLIPTRALQEIGAFSLTFPHYGEDDNLTDRAHFHGYKVGVVLNAAAIHDRASRKSSRKQRCTRKCLIPVIRMSNPCNPWTLKKSIAWLIGCSIKNLSSIPAASIRSLKEKADQITKNMERSREKGAFFR